ncbi:MAG: Sm-like protein lsm7 [Bogoriella megaspora]|nr:MAG: Sm-like protein lsm7 [Bogoriella megaspora]
MSERASIRGGRGGRGDRGGRGGRGGGAGGRDGGQQQDRPKKENILDLNRFVEKEIHVKFNGGREVKGTLKGYDQLMNLVLDDVRELMRDDNGNTSHRPLGLVVIRGTQLVFISPEDGAQEIANPFAAMEEQEEVLPG